MKMNEIKAICVFAGLAGEFPHPMASADGKEYTAEFKRGWDAALKELPQILAFYMAATGGKKSVSSQWKKFGADCFSVLQDFSEQLVSSQDKEIAQA